MKAKKLRYRQVHLDFHTSPAIPEIGTQFDRKLFQETLKVGHVDSITCFSSDHHGWSFHPTGVGRMHPHLAFDLLRAQIDACTEIDVKVPVYLTAGVDNVAAEAHPEWREIGYDGKYLGWTRGILKPGFKTLCFNTPYLDYLCAKIEEAVTLFPEADGIFLDIIHQNQCCCRYCLATMAERGLDPENAEDRQACADIVLLKYYERSTASCKVKDPDMPVFHNSGHIAAGNRKILPFQSHLELESLPTGGWGYDHFPLSAGYVKNLGMEFLGMTGKFHTTWGEFGGFKHPNALRYECAAMIAYGAKCSIGDQLHPSGKLDSSTYRIIGEAYREVEEKEPWCDGAENIADIGLLSSAANHIRGIQQEHNQENPADTGAVRILLEGHYLFDILDEEMEFSRYGMIVLPDDIRVHSKLKAKLDAYLAEGGRLFITGSSASGEDGKPLFDIGGTLSGLSEYSPDFIVADDPVRPDYVESPMVMYTRSLRLTAVAGTSLGRVYDPYFNRSWEHFSSHQHAPNRPDPSGYDAGVLNGNLLYLAHPVFSQYFACGAVAYRQFVTKCLDLLLGDKKTLRTNLPSTARVTLTVQEAENRKVMHLLYANTVMRGMFFDTTGDAIESGTSRPPKPIEVIEDLLPLHDVELIVKAEGVKRVTLEPQGIFASAKIEGGTVTMRIPSFVCHRMIVLHS